MPLLNTSLAHDNIVAIFLSADKSPFQLPPPACLISDPTRYGFNNFITDGKTVRRGCLSARLADGKTYNSFAAVVADDYLSAKGVDCGMEGKSIRLGKTVIPRFHGYDGGYVRTGDVGYQFLLDFRGPGKFSTISISDALALKDSGIFRDKIVLIGSMAASSNDLVETPVDPFAAGIIVHAQIINSFCVPPSTAIGPLKRPACFFAGAHWHSGAWPVWWPDFLSGHIFSSGGRF